MGVGDLGTSLTNLFTFTADILPFSLERDIKPEQNDSVDTDQEVYNAENISVNKLLKLFFFCFVPTVLSCHSLGTRCRCNFCLFVFFCIKGADPVSKSWSEIFIMFGGHKVLYIYITVSTADT